MHLVAASCSRNVLLLFVLPLPSTAVMGWSLWWGNPVNCSVSSLDRVAEGDSKSTTSSSGSQISNPPVSFYSQTASWPDGSCPDCASRLDRTDCRHGCGWRLPARASTQMRAASGWVWTKVGGYEGDGGMNRLGRARVRCAGVDFDLRLQPPYLTAPRSTATSS